MLEKQVSWLCFQSMLQIAKTVYHSAYQYILHPYYKRERFFNMNSVTTTRGTV